MPYGGLHSVSLPQSLSTVLSCQRLGREIAGAGPGRAIGGSAQSPRLEERFANGIGLTALGLSRSDSLISGPPARVVIYESLNRKLTAASRGGARASPGDRTGAA